MKMYGIIVNNVISLTSVIRKHRRCVILFIILFHASRAHSNSHSLSLWRFSLALTLSLQSHNSPLPHDSDSPPSLTKVLPHILLRRHHRFTRVLLRRCQHFVFSIPRDFLPVLVPENVLSEQCLCFVSKIVHSKNVLVDLKMLLFFLKKIMLSKSVVFFLAF